MPGASYPKPDNERRTRYRQAFDWVTLPDGPVGKAPPLPPWRAWSDETVAWWRDLWSRPQAAMWDPSGATLTVAAYVYEAMVMREGSTAALAAELRQHYDRHGLSPKAMLQLRWRAEGPEGEVTEPDRLADARRRRLRRQLP